MSASNTGENRTDGRFTKADPRINRNGRPRTFDETRKLAQAIAHEPLKSSDGKTFTVAEAILRSWARSKVPALQLQFFFYAFGKVPERLETEGITREHIFVTFTKPREPVGANGAANGRS